MTPAPDPLASRAVLIGVSDFALLDGLPAVDSNLKALRELLLQHDLWGLPLEYCRVVSNPQTPRQLSKPIAEAAEEATDTLLVYYSGHGLIEPKTGELHLAVGDSDPRSVHDTAAPYEWIRWTVAHSRAARRIVVVDCCYSARAFGVQSAEAAFQVEGTYLLAAAAENAVALAPPGEQFTAFTGELVKLLQYGVPTEEEFLDLDTVYTRLRIELTMRGRPEPHRLCRDGLGKAPFVRNAAYEPVTSRRGWGPELDQVPASQPTGGMERESEPYVRLASLRILLTQLITQVSLAQSVADTLQTVASGVVAGLGYEVAAVNVVRADGDLIVAALAGSQEAEEALVGRVGSRPSWERRLSMGERWGTLRYISHNEGRVLTGDDVPQWHTDGPEPKFPDEWHPQDRLYAPMYASTGELIGVISVDRPRTGRLPGPWGQEALQVYAAHAAVAISNSRLKANMQRALVRLEREQEALRESEEAFRHAFEYAPNGMLVTELESDHSGRLVRVNDALCRLVGRSASALQRSSFTDLVHPDDLTALLRASVEGGHAELRLARRDGSYVWVSLRNSVIANARDGQRSLLTHVQDIDSYKRSEST